MQVLSNLSLKNDHRLRFRQINNTGHRHLSNKENFFDTVKATV